MPRVHPISDPPLQAQRQHRAGGRCGAGASCRKRTAARPFQPHFTPFPGQVVSLTRSHHLPDRLPKTSSVRPTPVIRLIPATPVICSLHCLLHILLSYPRLGPHPPPARPHRRLTAASSAFAFGARARSTKAAEAAGCKIGRLCNRIGAHSRHSILTDLWQLNVGLCTEPI